MSTGSNSYFASRAVQYSLVMHDRSKYRALLLWQFLFIVLSLSWLWAPWLNPHLSLHTSVISDFEALNQPFSVIYRGADLLAGMLLLLMALYLTTRTTLRRQPLILVLIFTVGISMFLDPLFPKSCLYLYGHCAHAVTTLSTQIHDVESSLAYIALLILVLYDAFARRKIASISTSIVHIIFGLYVVFNIPSLEHFTTLSQFIYQLTASVWIAWFCRELLLGTTVVPQGRLSLGIRYGMAAWTFLMGVTAILLGLAGGRHALFDRALDMAGGAWFAPHAIIAGVILLYIGRHLFRGELRARQIVLAIFGIQIIMYAAITPAPALLYIYLIGFATLFILRDSFDRGTAPATWQIRLRDLSYLIGGVTVGTILAAIFIANHIEARRITADALNHFGLFFFRNPPIHFQLRHSEVLFANTLNVFIIAVATGVLWVLFRPTIRPRHATDAERREARRILMARSKSSEDFFKLWPYDKAYFWDETGSTFLAYRQVGSIAYLLADPVGRHPAALLESFRQYCRAERLKLACLPIYESSRAMYEAHHFTLLQIGASAVINITHFTEVTTHDKWWRWQRNRAAKRGYTHHISMPPHRTELLEQWRIVSNAWLGAGNHAERGFALGYFDAGYLDECTVHYLTDEAGTVTAFVNILPQFRPSSVATIDLLRFLPGHDGTMPYLLYETVMSVQNDESFRSFDLGFVPFATTDSRLMQIAKLIGGKRFSSKGLEQFKNKFDPAWEPNYLAYEGDLADLTQIATNLEKAMQANTLRDKDDL